MSHVLYAVCISVASSGLAAPENVPAATDPNPVCRELFGLLDLTRADLTAVRKQVEAGDLPAAMHEYRAFLAARMAKLAPQRAHSYWLHNPADADRLLDGELLTARYGDPKIVYTVPIGKPGQINFFTELPNYREIARDISTMQWINKHCEAYAKTKDAKYLQAWCETWADYLAHWDAQWAAVKANPAMWGKGPQREGRIGGIEWAGGQTLYTAWRLTTLHTGIIAMLQLAPANGHLDTLDMDVLAGLLVCVATVEIANARRILGIAGRLTPNQVRYLAEQVLNCGLTFCEFKDAKAWRDESIPVCTLTSLPDGTSREQSLNYFINYFPGLIRKIRNGMPPQELDTALIARLETLNKYQGRVLPSLARPDGFRPATGTDPVWGNYGKTQALKPPSPAVTSILFPYGGYAVQRDGWQSDSLYLFMKACRPNMGHWRSQDGGLQLSAYGRNLLVSPMGEVYDSRDVELGWRRYWDSSVSQNAVLVDGMATAERKGDFNALDAMRWHTSARFDFMETEIVGPYQGHDFHVNGTAYPERVKRGEVKDPPAAKDVVHRRQVHFIREAGCWIVVDRIRSKTAHDFTQTWCYGPEYAEGEVVADDAKKTVCTQQADAPNLSLYQFGVPALKYSKYFGVYTADAILGWVGILKDREAWTYTPAVNVHANWRGQGEQILITFLCPHRDLTPRITAIVDCSGGGIRGFDATLTDGRQVRFRAVADPAPLTAAGIAAEAGSLLVVADPDRKKTGLVLDARTFAGKPVKTPDFEFEADATAVSETVPVTAPTGFHWAGEDAALIPRYSPATARE